MHSTCAVVACLTDNLQEASPKPGESLLATGEEWCGEAGQLSDSPAIAGGVLRQDGDVSLHEAEEPGLCSRQASFLLPL
jgi:hypothetical protein